MNSTIEKSKTEKRTTTRLLVNVAITLFFTIGGCCGRLVHLPVNTTVTEGNRATLQCQTDQPLTVFWYFNGKEIFYGGKISLKYSSKFDIETISTVSGKYYNLVIPSADAWYSGLYTCGDDEGQGEKQSAWVTVSESPIREANGTTEANDNSRASTGTDAKLIIIITAAASSAALVVGLFAICIYWFSRRKKNNCIEKPDGGDKALITQKKKTTKCKVKQTNDNQEKERKAPMVINNRQFGFQKTRNTFKKSEAAAPTAPDLGNSRSKLRGTKNGTSTKNKNDSSLTANAIQGNDSILIHTEASAQPDHEDALETDSSCINQEEELLCNASCTIATEDINDKEDTAKKENSEAVHLMQTSTISDKGNSSEAGIHNC